MSDTNSIPMSDHEPFWVEMEETLGAPKYKACAYCGLHKNFHGRFVGASAEADDAVQDGLDWLFNVLDIDNTTH